MCTMRDFHVEIPKLTQIRVFVLLVCVSDIHARHILVHSVNKTHCLRPVSQTVISIQRCNSNEHISCL